MLFQSNGSLHFQQFIEILILDIVCFCHVGTMVGTEQENFKSQGLQITRMLDYFSIARMQFPSIFYPHKFLFCVLYSHQSSSLLQQVCSHGGAYFHKKCANLVTEFDFSQVKNDTCFFLKSNTLISNAKLKLAKIQAKAKQHPEVLTLPCYHPKIREQILYAKEQVSHENVKQH